MSFIHDDFLLSSSQAVRLFHEYAENEPILDFHNHLPPDEIANNRKFENLADAWLESDHYKWRAMRANGTPEELVTGNGDPKEKYLAWAATIPHSLGNPLYHWTHLELKRCFDIDTLLGPETAEEIWEAANAKLQAPNFSAHGMLEKFQVNALCTTDDPAAPTTDHERIAADDHVGTGVYPTFRPDKAWGVGDAPSFLNWIENLEIQADKEINHLNDFLECLARRVNHFHEIGCRLSDHSFPTFPSSFPNEDRARQIFADVLDGVSANTEDENNFTGFIMLFLGRLYQAKGWTMQVHLGPLRNNSSRLLKEFGPDAGTDSIGDRSQADNMRAFLDKLDKDESLPKTIIYNNNPADNFTVATMLGNFQRDIPGKMQFGSGWWHLDQRDGMEEQIKTLANVGLLSHFVGMLTDSRSFLSFPRHEYFRRILCNLLGNWMEEGFVPDDFELIGNLTKRVCYANAKNYLGLEIS